MSTTLYEATVERFIQTLGGVAGCLERGRDHCAERGLDLEELVQSRLWSDMLPLSFQLVSVVRHSRGAIEGVREGVFSPPPRETFSYDQLQARVGEAREWLSAIAPDEIEALADRDMIFKAGERTVPYTGAGFLLSFSLPNFYFHAATAYGILRSKGVPLGKRDYIGQLRTRT